MLRACCSCSYDIFSRKWLNWVSVLRKVDSYSESINLLLVSMQSISIFLKSQRCFGIYKASLYSTWVVYDAVWWMDEQRFSTNKFIISFTCNVYTSIGRPFINWTCHYLVPFWALEVLFFFGFFCFPDFVGAFAFVLLALGLFKFDGLWLGLAEASLLPLPLEGDWEAWTHTPDLHTWQFEESSNAIVNHCSQYW